MGLFAIFIFAYCIFVLLATDPLTRINRICTPVVTWPERLIVSGVRIFAPDNVPAVEKSFGKGFTTCRRWTFGVLYRPEYEKMKAEQEARKAAEQAKAVRASAPAKEGS